MESMRTWHVWWLLHNKFTVIMGDSVQWAVYKDLVLLLQKDCVLSLRQLKAKGQLSFQKNMLLEGRNWGRMHNGPHYREVREFYSAPHLVCFFLTQAYSRYMEHILGELLRGEQGPDMVVVYAYLWDLPNYGQPSCRRFQENLQTLFLGLHRVLRKSCLVVWNTDMPMAKKVSGGFLPPEDDPRREYLREDLEETNYYSAALASLYGFVVLDLHFHFQQQG